MKVETDSVCGPAKIRGLAVSVTSADGSPVLIGEYSRLMSGTLVTDKKPRWLWRFLKRLSFGWIKDSTTTFYGLPFAEFYFDDKLLSRTPLYVIPLLGASFYQFGSKGLRVAEGERAVARLDMPDRLQEIVQNVKVTLHLLR